MNQHNYHIYQRKLYALGSIAQLSLQRLLCCLSLKNVTFKDKADEDLFNKESKEDQEAIAIGKVFSLNKDKVKKLSNLFTERTNVDLIYKDFPNRVLSETIDASLLDTSSLAQILLEIKTYPVSHQYYHKGLTCTSCKSKTSLTCCTKCKDSNHPCLKCGKERCKGSCCETNSFCSHACSNCETLTSDCLDSFNSKYVCCQTCGLCMKCVLDINKLTCWQDIIEKLVDGQKIGLCDIFLLRLSISIIRDFRNLMSHLTTAKCEQMDNGTFTDSKVPEFCKTWDKITKVFQFAVKNVFDYLLKEKAITQRNMTKHLVCLRAIIVATGHDDLDVYANRINKYLEIEQFSLNRIENKLEDLKTIMEKGVDIQKTSDKKSLKIVCKYDDSQSPVNLCLKSSKETDNQENQVVKFVNEFKNAMNSALGNDVSVLFVGVMENNINKKAHSMKFTIESKSEKINFNEYKDYMGNEMAKALWIRIEKKLIENLPKNSELCLMEWDVSSIIIKATLRKTSGEDWKQEELTEIDEKMSIFAKEFDLFTEEFSQCIMTYEGSKVEAVPSKSLVFRINTLTDDAAERFKQIIKGRLFTRSIFRAAY